MSPARSMYVELEEDNILDYVVLGNGDKNIVCIPGLSDGLGTVQGKHILLSHYYRRFKKRYTVYVFSRRRNLPESWSTKDMADNLVAACRAIGITNPHILGISMGGMIAQHIAVHHPDFWDTMVLGITGPEANDTVRSVIASWINSIEKDKIKDYREDLLEKTYTEEYLHKTRVLAPLIKMAVKIRDKDRFLKQAHACLEHDAHGSLRTVKKPVLVIGGDSDKIVGPESSEKLHAAIPGSELQLFKGIGHSLCEERQKEFDAQVLHFFERYENTGHP